MATVWTVALLLSPLDPDFTAGEVLDHLISWREGAALYPPLGDAPPFRVLNYPPLALLAARGLAGLGFHDLAAGRVANTLALASLVAVAAAWARSRGARGAVLAGTVGLLGASFPVLYASGQFHVEVWGAALTLGGFALLDRGRSARHAAVAGAALGVNLAEMQAWKRELPAVCARLADGPAILSEDVGLARACGRPVLMHPFIMTSLAERGLWDPAPVEAAVLRGDVPVVVVHFDPTTQPGPPSSERWTPGLLRAFAGAPHVEPLGPGTWVARW